MAKKLKKDKHFIPSELPVVTEYENTFISDFNASAAASLIEILKYLSKVTATSIKNGLEGFEKSFENEFEKANHNVGDLHPNGLWYWKEYKPGQFDWRVIPKKKTNKKKNINIWEIDENINKLKTSIDCVKYIQSKKIITPESDLSNCDLDSAKSICSSLYNLHTFFKFEPITIRSRKISATMQAIDGRLIEINSKFFNNFDRKKYYNRIVVEYKKQIIEGIKDLDDEIKNPINRPAIIADLKKYKDKLLLKDKKFPRWTTGEVKSMTQDIIIHEMGHILNSQCSGGCGHRFTLNAKRSNDYFQMCRNLNKERNEVFKKYLNEKVCISEYSTIKPAEFFAECFVAYIHKDKALPTYVRTFMNKYFKLTNPKI